MRSLLPQTVVFTTAGLLAGCMPIHAQQADTTVGPEIQYQSHCARTSRSYDAQPSGAEVSIDNVTFSGFLQMPISDQEEIATSISQETHAYPLDGLIEEALERVRLGWQDRGYFNVAVSGDTRTLAKNAADVHIALFVHVDEGPRYTLGGITFKHNKSLADVKRLRALFPINDGEVFSREKITKGLENLQKAFGEFGFANYTGVPATTFDDEQKVAFLRIDVDEGRQFICRQHQHSWAGRPCSAGAIEGRSHSNRANLQQETGRTVSLATQLPFPRLRMPNSGTIGHG